MKDLFMRYSADHQNKVNKAFHLICVPVIYWAVIGMLWSVPFVIWSGAPSFINWSTLIITAVVVVYYLPKSTHAFCAMSVLSLIGFMLFSWLELSGYPILWIAIAMFLIGWVGQFIGHYFEGTKPAFFDELQFLLVGPAWVMEEILSAIGLGQPDKS